MTHDLLVLAGGEARRLGGVSKADVVVGGRRLLDHVLDAAVGARRTVVVGPPGLVGSDDPRDLRGVREEPPLGGPVAGIAAGLDVLDGRAPADDGRSWPVTGDEPDVLVVACDTPRAARAVAVLTAALADEPTADGARLVTAGGAHLVALHRRAALRRALSDLAAERGPTGVRGASVRALAARLAWVDVPDPGGLGEDADTWEAVHDLDEALRRDRVSDDRPGPDPLHRWVADLVAELGIDPDGVDVDALLDLSRDIAHGVMRPAVPLTAFLVGCAVTARGGSHADLEAVTAQVRALVERRQP